MKYSSLTALTILAFIATGCDYLENLGGGESSGGTEAISSSATDPVSPAQVDAPKKSEPEPEPEPEPDAPLATTVTLSAFSDFDCTSAWTTRDGALGLAANSGSGTCQATFAGVSSKYQVSITVQTEFDGKPHYILSINGNKIASGQYSLSSSLGCDCPKEKWRSVCPDQNVEIDAGTHQVSTGDIIKFYGQEDWGCSGHGAYAKWHQISFVPVH